MRTIYNVEYSAVRNCPHFLTYATSPWSTSKSYTQTEVTNEVYLLVYRYYRPHPKNEGGTFFTGVCLLTFRGRSTPIWLTGGTPSFLMGGERGYPDPSRCGVPPSSPDRGYPITGQDREVPPSQVRMGGGVPPTETA